MHPNAPARYQQSVAANQTMPVIYRPWLITTALLGSLLGCVAQPTRADSLGDNYVDLSVGHIEGDFATTVSSSLTSLTAVLGHYFTVGEGRRLDASVSLSYLELASDGQSNQTGLGDVIGKLGTSFELDDFTLYPAAAIKLPTADENKQLGSGETDYGGFFSLTHPCAAFICGAGLDYIVLGDPPGVNYHDIKRINLNVFRRFGRLGVGAYVQRESALLDGTDNPQSVGLNLFYVLGAKQALYTEFKAGLNQVAADSVARIGMVQWF